MLPRIVEPTGSSDRHRGLPDRCGALRAALIICLAAMQAACALGPAAQDHVTVSEVREQMTLDDRHIAAMAVQIAMERRDDNEASTWTNGLSGNHGAVVPRRTYRTRAGAFCRQYDEIMTVAGVAVREERVACRDGSGHWATIT